MTTSLIVMLELRNFGHITIFTIQFKSSDKAFLVASWREIMTSQLFNQNAFILRRPAVINFADIIRIPTMFIKKPLRLKKVQRIRN